MHTAAPTSTHRRARLPRRRSTGKRRGVSASLESSLPASRRSKTSDGWTCRIDEFHRAPSSASSDSRSTDITNLQVVAKPTEPSREMLSNRRHTNVQPGSHLGLAPPERVHQQHHRALLGRQALQRRLQTRLHLGILDRLSSHERRPVADEPNTDALPTGPPGTDTPPCSPQPQGDPSAPTPNSTHPTWPPRPSTGPYTATSACNSFGSTSPTKRMNSTRPGVAEESTPINSKTSRTHHNRDSHPKKALRPGTRQTMPIPQKLASDRQPRGNLLATSREDEWRTSTTASDRRPNRSVSTPNNPSAPVARPAQCGPTAVLGNRGSSRAGRSVQAVDLIAFGGRER